MKSKLLIMATINIIFLMLLSGCSNSKSSDIQVGTPSKATSIYNEKTNSQAKQSIIQSKPDMDFSSYTGDWVCKEKATSIEIKVDSLGNVTGCITTVVDSHVPSSSIEGIIKGGILTSKLLVDDADSGTLVLSFKESEVLIGNVKLDKDIDYWTLEQGDMQFIRYSDVDNSNNENLINSDTTGIGKSETLKQLQDKGFQLIPEEIMNLKKEQVLKLLGDDYKVIQTGAEASEEGYYYEKYGITIVFDDFSKPDMIKDIECSEKVNVMGTKIGMTFSEIENILGNGNKSELVQIEQDQAKYELDYNYDYFVVWFGALDKNGKTTVLEIRRNYMN